MDTVRTSLVASRAQLHRAPASGALGGAHAGPVRQKVTAATDCYLTSLSRFTRTLRLLLGTMMMMVR